MVKLTQAKCRKWIKALRSGGYRQGRGWLQYSNQHGKFHCCLGVASEVCNLPPDGRCNLNTSEIDGLDWRDHDELVDMNDSKDPKYSFEDIADYIEQVILPKCPVR